MQPSQKDVEDRNKPHPKSDCQGLDVNALGCKSETTGQDFAITVILQKIYRLCKALDLSGS